MMDMGRWAMIGVVLGVYLLLAGLGFMALARDYLVNPREPLQVELHYPTQLPVIPTQVPPDDVRVRLGERYDGIPGRAGEDYQPPPDGSGGFTASDFAGHGSVASATHALTIPDCIPSGNYPWTRYAIAWPAVGVHKPDHVLYSGLDISAAFVFQERTPPSDQFGPQPNPQAQDKSPTVLAIDGADYHLMVSRDRLDCRLYEGKTWMLRN